MKRNIMMWLMAALTVAVLTACGGGAGGGGDDGSVPDKTPPSIQSMTPDDGATAVATNVTIKVVWSEAVVNVAAANFELKEFVSGSVIAINAPTVNGKETDFKPTADLKPATKYQATVKNVSDQSGNLFASQTWTFTTASGGGGNTTPKPVDWTPITGATNVPLDIQPQVTFDANIDPASATPANVRMNNGAVAGTIVVNEKVVIFVPNALLTANAEQVYTVSGVKDMAGNVMSGVFNLPFKTGSSIGTLDITTFTAIINGGASRGTWSPATGVADVLLDGKSWDFAVRKTPINVKNATTYRATFTCTSVPANLPIQVELKMDAAPNTSYALLNTTCNGKVIANLPATEKLPASGNDPNGRFAINVGAKAGKYTLSSAMFIETTN
jgi:hypothetical protein